MKTIVDLPDDLAGQVKTLAVEENRQLDDVVTDLVRTGLAVEQRAALKVRAKRVAIPPKRIEKALLGKNRSLLDLRGSFKVGPGDPVKDVRIARKRMGTDGA